MSEARRSSRIKQLQSKQNLLKGTRLTAKKKIQKSTVANKETEAATSDTQCVHNSRSEDAAVGECVKRTKTTDQPSAKRKSKVLNAKNLKSCGRF